MSMSSNGDHIKSGCNVILRSRRCAKRACTTQINVFTLASSATHQQTTGHGLKASDKFMDLIADPLIVVPISLPVFILNLQLFHWKIAANPLGVEVLIVTMPLSYWCDTPATCRRFRRLCRDTVRPTWGHSGGVTLKAHSHDHQRPQATQKPLFQKATVSRVNVSAPKSRFLQCVIGIADTRNGQGFGNKTMQCHLAIRVRWKVTGNL